ncbi:universal stress protein [Hymenobacter wooponensis]|uniref:Universal stress protein n=1 Tax=Hymenobacter wooponensis TaxID=1525360 RepID=A0A4Z0MGW0_9BACT|nr:universal stress protein [Hymenobacter wooponensis]TGD78784.1 universal stress protein [Hymenobacter wooponensis]
MSSSIVVLTDFYAVSNRALSYAAGLAVPLGAHLVLLHVRHNGLLCPDEEAGAHTVRQTRQALYSLAETQPVPTQVEISELMLPAAVTEAIRHHQPQLLVLGHPSEESPLAQDFAKVALNLLHHVRFPLLLVPPVGWDAFPPRHVLLALDGEPFSLYDNQQILPHLSQALHGTVELVQITDPTATQPTAAHLLRIVQTSGLAEGLTTEQVHLVPETTSTASDIQRVCGDLNADLLVLIARPHTVLEGLVHRSVTAQLIRESAIPVLLLPSLD